MKKLFLNMALLAVGLLTVNAQFVDRVTYVSTAADLKKLRPGTTNTYAMILGWAAPGDGGQQLYRFTPTSSAATNYGIITLTTDSTAQWKRTPANFGGSAPRTQSLTAAAGTILAEASTVRVGGASASVTITNTPTIADGIDGEELTIEGTHDSNTVIISDKGTLPSSNIELDITGSATNRTLGAGDILKLKFNGTLSTWQEVSFKNN